MDFWNLQLGMSKKVGRDFRFDWEKFPRWIVAEASRVGMFPGVAYAGMHVYASYDSASRRDIGLRNWMRNWLDLQPGIQVVLKERRPRQAPRCPRCHESIQVCPACGNDLSGTQEKGVDSALVTDMIRLAWEGAYDVAVLVSSDSDFIPAVEYLDSRGFKVIQAGFPPAGASLAAPCWASFDLYRHRSQFERR